MRFDPDIYPEHAKAHAAADQSKNLSRFLDSLLHDQGFVLAEKDHSGRLFPTLKHTPDMIASYIGIDQDALAGELRQMLDELGEPINDKEKT
jgi:hypothetical protein